MQTRLWWLHIGTCVDSTCNDCVDEREPYEVYLQCIPTAVKSTALSHAPDRGMLKHADNAVSTWVSTLPPERDTKRCPKTIADSLESDHYCIKSYFSVSISKPTIIYRPVWNMASIDRPSFIAELSSVSEFSFVEKANQFCDFIRTVLDKHAPLLYGKL